MYDLLIRNGRVVDGTGNPWFRADVAVKDGTVAAIGRIEGKAERVIDADGLFVAPGFIFVSASPAEQRESRPARYHSTSVDM